jgi:hypothetical protein
MYHKITLNDQAIVEEALRTMREKGPTVPAAEVRKFLTKIGEEIDRTGTLTRESVDVLLGPLNVTAI